MCEVCVCFFSLCVVLLILDVCFVVGVIVEHNITYNLSWDVAAVMRRWSQGLVLIGKLLT